MGSKGSINMAAVSSSRLDADEEDVDADDCDTSNLLSLSDPAMSLVCQQELDVQHYTKSLSQSMNVRLKDPGIGCDDMDGNKLSSNLSCVT